MTNLDDRTTERTYKSILFEVMPLAVGAERSVAGRIDVRGLFYACRRLYLSHPERPYTREQRYAQAKKNPEHILDYDYFNNQIIPHYEREYGEIEGLSRDPRGHLYEAHTGEEDEGQEIGTRFVEDFEPPEHYYDKVLYVEKHGIAQGLIDLGLGRRYDMAIVAAQGYGTVANRDLLRRFADEGYQVFVLHDCDVDGYGIIANLREGNERASGLESGVIDLGMSLADALAFDPPLLGEEAKRQKAIPSATAAHLTDEEYRMFVGRRRNQKVFEYKRYELNEIPARQRAPFVARQLVANGVRPKVIAPDRYLGETALEMRDLDISSVIRMAVDEIVDTDGIVEALLPRFRERYGLEDTAVLREEIEHAFERRPLSSWRGVLLQRIENSGRSLREEIEDAVREQIAANI
jgi:hypothetical protein